MSNTARTTGEYSYNLEAEARVGSRIRCIDASGLMGRPLQYGNLYTIKSYDGTYVELEGLSGRFYYTRFKDVGEPKKSAPASKDTNPKEAVGSTKLPMHLVPDAALAHVSMAFYEGATKYGSYNWRVAGVRASTYIAAARRHLSKWWNGYNCDPKTRVHHLANAAACCMILLDAEVQGLLNDDRPPRQDLEKLFDELGAVQQHLFEMHKDLNPKHCTEK